MKRQVDVAIVGAGTAGLAAYRAAVAAGASVALIEQGALGTMCARVGCMPSKLLLASAEVAHTANRAAEFGIACSPRVDGAAVMDRVRRERDWFVERVIADMTSIPPEHQIRGGARFVAPGVLEVDDHVIEARAVVIATGSTPFIPPTFASLADRLVVSDDVFDWPTLPESVAVFGSGGIGLELGQALHRLGVRVKVFGRNGAMAGLTDPVVRAAALAALSSEMPIEANATIHEVRRNDSGVVVEIEGGHGRVEHYELALVAAGRTPNFKSLRLENAGVALDTDGTPLFDRATLQCGKAPVFIAGDATDDVPVLHEARAEGNIAGQNAARYPNVQSWPRCSRLQITFCDPQIAVVGPSFDDLARHPLVVGAVSFAEQGRSRIMGQNRGVAHLYAHPTSGRFLGASIVGPQAEHLAHLLAWAHQAALTIEQMLAMPIYHPVVEEGLRTALRDARTKMEGQRQPTVAEARAASPRLAARG